MAWVRRASSKAVRSRINRPLVAAIDVDTATTSGTARPSAWGQEMTSTVTARSMAKAKVCSLKNNQENTVKQLTDRAMTVSQEAARMAKYCVRDLLACAS